MVLPGCIDTYVHASAAGLERLRRDLVEVHGLADYLAAVRAYADANPGSGWITGGGWSIGVFPGGGVPSRHDLDQVAPDRPVFLSNRDHDAAWVNSKAVELAGVTASTRDPAYGRIERVPDGAPAGTLQEGANADDVSGSIEAGKAADLVVLDRNLFEHPVEETALARLDLTIAGGQVVSELADR